MQFILKSLATGLTISLAEHKDYIVGRKDCDIVITGDSSVSRKHAILKVTKKRVEVFDCGATFHTFVNRKEITANQPIRLEINDVILFGARKSEYVLQKEIKYKYVTTTTNISPSQREALCQTVAQCGGILVDTWSKHCTHLTTGKIVLSEKVLEALVDGKPFVLPEYWIALENSIKNKLKEPDINKYNKPPIDETVNRGDIEENIFEYKEKRRTLFKDKVFVFATTIKKNMLLKVIEQCGGECKAWQETPLILYEVQKDPKTHLIIALDSDQAKGFTEFIKEYETQKKRTITVNEIAMAIVKCSTEQDCNPDFDIVHHVLGNRLVTQKDTNTEEPLRIVPETEESDLSYDAKSKHRRGDCDDPMTIPPTFINEMGESQDINMPSTSGANKFEFNDVILIDDDEDDIIPVKRRNKDERTDNAKKLKLQKGISNEKKIRDSDEGDKISKKITVAVDENDGPTTHYKRLNPEERNEGAKKIRLEVRTSPSQKENRGEHVTEFSASQKSKGDLLEKSICKTQDFIKISSKKRKATELAAEAESQPDEPPKKANQNQKIDMNNQVNPFALMMSCSSRTKSTTSAKPNPFELSKRFSQIEKAKSREDLQENPFKKVISSKLNSTRTKSNESVEQENITRRPSVAIVKAEKSVEKNTTWGGDITKISVLGLSWMSKNSTNVKHEKVKQDDPELSKIIEIFKDCVKVQTLTLRDYRRHDTSINNTTRDVTDGNRKANYKRFKKIAPLNPQINIITKSQLIKVGPGKTNAIDIARRNAESDDEGETQKVRSKKIIL